MKKVFKEIMSTLINDYSFDKKYLENELNKRVIEKGDNKNTYSDFFWECLNVLLEHFKTNTQVDKQTSYWLIKNIYLMMYKVKYEIRENTTPITIMLHQLELDTRIESSKGGIFEEDIIFICKNACDYCLQFDGTRIPIETIKIQFPIDYRKCLNKWGCSFIFSSIPRRDNDERLIRKKK